MLSLGASLSGGIILLTSFISASPHIAARANETIPLEAPSSPSLQVKPDPPNPSISDGYPTPTDKIILSFGHAPLNFESIADAAYDGLIWILAQTSGPRGGKWQTDPVPGGNYKRLEESYQIDIGTDLYSEKDMTYIDLTFVFKLIYKFARLYQLREFKIQWLKGGKPHVYGELKNRARLAGSQGNGANVA